MRVLGVLGFLLVTALAGCGGHSASPESVARAWSNAINTGNNDAAAKLFADDAQIVQPGHVIRLHSHSEAVAWNAALPCSGTILEVVDADETATVTFRLGNRPSGACDGTGATVRAIFRVRDGKIVLWHQLGNESAAGTQSI